MYSGINGVAGITAVILFSVVISTSLQLPLSTVEAEIDSIVYLGTVNMKSFYADLTRRNWTEAGKFCEDAHMKLASIMTKEEATFLYQSNDNDTFYGHVWTSGRDANDHRQFAWNNTNESINPEVVSYMYIQEPIYKCVAIVPYSYLKRVEYHPHPCSSEFGSLCQVQH